MRKPKGPELKMPELKVPAFLTDLFYDLRDRRLLPLVALVVVAIAAVPFLLGGDAEEATVTAPSLDVPALGSGSAKTSSLTVVEAKPGLRDYRKRLRNRTPTDPFEQQYTGLPEGAQVETKTTSSDAGSSSGGESPGSVSVEVEGTDEVAEPAPNPGQDGGGPGGTSPGSGSGKVDPSDPEMRFYAFRPEVRFGVAGSGELNLYEEMPLGQLLPKQLPVVVFIGVSEDGERVAFDVSDEVTMVRGPGRCIGGKQNCSVLILRAGQAVDVLTGTPGRAFRLDVVRIDFVEVKRPKPAHSPQTKRRPAFRISVP